MFECFIMSHFNHCPAVWHFCKISDFKKIENIQKRALRYIIKDYSSTYTELGNMACKPLLRVHRIKLIMNGIFKIINKIRPMVIYGKRSLSYEGAQICNQLDDNIKRTLNLKVFRRRIKKWKGTICSCFNCTLFSLNLM